MFAGILDRAYSTVTNIGAPMWVMDPAVNTPRRARSPCQTTCSTLCAAWRASNLRCRYIWAPRLVKLNDGTFQSVYVVGLG